jgi:hypothetical protein
MRFPSLMSVAMKKSPLVARSESPLVASWDCPITGRYTVNRTVPTRRVGTFSWPPAGTTTWPLTPDSLDFRR